MIEEVINDIGLIGDSVNTIPAMIDLAKLNGSLRVIAHPESHWMYELIPKKYNISLISKPTTFVGYSFDLTEAFAFSNANDLYMSQCHHHRFGLPVPVYPLSPELTIRDIGVTDYDYLLAPFGRSAGENERWPKEKWIELKKSLEKEGFKVGVLGAGTNYPFEWGSNTQFGHPMVEVLNLIKKCRRGVISIVTGISHLCYAVDAKNYLLTNQLGAWGQNPDAVRIETYIPNITVEEVLEVLKCQ